MIPRIIHQYWSGGPLPEEFAGYTEGWRRLHPGWELRFWNDGDLPDLVNQDLYDRAAKISPTAPQQFRSDVLRYELLLRFGGVWLDVDIAPQKPLDDLCHGFAWACWEVPGQWINNAALAAIPYHPLLVDLVILLPDNVARFGRLAGNTVKSGPQFLTRPALRHGIEVHPREYFFPYGWNELHREKEAFPDAYGIHRWNNRRRRQK